MDDAELLAALGENTAFFRAVGRASPGAQLVERDGVLACVASVAPDRSVLNSVVYGSSAALLSRYDELRGVYEAAGVRAWTVWVPPVDGEVTEFLGARGHVLDAAPQMMGMALDGLPDSRPAGPGDWSRELEPAILGRINDIAYGFEPSFEKAFVGFPLDAAHWYVARVESEPVACLMTSDEGTDVDVNMVAALPAARGRGLVTDLLTHALIDARERGLRSTTLVATQLGRPVYERLGYRPLGEIQMWERRT